MQPTNHSTINNLLGFAFLQWQSRFGWTIKLELEEEGRSRRRFLCERRRPIIIYLKYFRSERNIRLRFKVDSKSSQWNEWRKTLKVKKKNNFESLFLIFTGYWVFAFLAFLLSTTSLDEAPMRSLFQIFFINNGAIEIQIRKFPKFIKFLVED